MASRRCRKLLSIIFLLIPSNKSIKCHLKYKHGVKEGIKEKEMCSSNTHKNSHL